VQPRNRVVAGLLVTLACASEPSPRALQLVPLGDLPAVAVTATLEVRNQTADSYSFQPCYYDIEQWSHGLWRTLVSHPTPVEDCAAVRIAVGPGETARTIAALPAPRGAGEYRVVLTQIGVDQGAAWRPDPLASEPFPLEAFDPPVRVATSLQRGQRVSVRRCRP
jgi:hypothetical protein